MSHRTVFIGYSASQAKNGPAKTANAQGVKCTRIFDENLYFLVFLFSFSVFAEENKDCEKAWTTLAINQCMHKDLVAAEEVLGKYLAKSLERYSEDSVSVNSIKKEMITMKVNSTIILMKLSIKFH